VTGARWSLPGGEAVLLLRAVIANGDFNEYWSYHVRREYQPWIFSGIRRIGTPIAERCR
jgi:hypothetical protein